MELKDFTEKEQEQINQGISTAEISDKEAAKKILALVPEEWIKRIPFFVRGHATTKTVERVAKQYPELYAVAKRQGDLPEKEGEELRKIMTAIFEEKDYDDDSYFCLMAVRSSDADDAVYKRIVELFQSETTKQIFQDEFNGYFVPAWEVQK